MAQPASPPVPRHKYLTRWTQLVTERASWWTHWKDLSDYMMPRSGRFFVQDRDRGNERNGHIYDNTATRAMRVLSAGLMSGITSPARPWFRLETTDPNLMKSPAVKQWLNDVSGLMLTVFARSNTYRVLHSMYEELAVYGTACALIVPDYNNVIQLFPLTCGEYCLATNWKGQVNTLYREFQKTVHEVVTEFGYDNCTPMVQSQYDNGNLDSWVTVVHAIEPRTDRDPKKSDAKNMAWRSVYFERGSQPDQYLRESGFKRFAAVAPRWAISGGDIYGNSPGMESLGDIKQLQFEQLRKAQGIDYQTNPPLQVPGSLKNRDVERMPGGVSFVDAVGQGGGIKTMFDVQLELQALLSDIQDVRQRINDTFYVDIFLMVAQNDTGRMTATEVSARQQEKMLMLGPVLERLTNELINPLVEITFDYIMDAGIAPAPPPELEGREISVALISMLAQAQQAINTNSIDRFTAGLAGVAQLKPEVLDNLDGDAWADIYADSLGLDPRLLLSPDKVKAQRAQRAQAQAQQAQMAALNQGADTAQKLAATDTSGANALTDMTRQYSGY
ncbi:MAG: phage head-tail adapter protein [Castellaniella sp.]|uniref:portal protein n=1 Tax=Castellaniella sp. TaxID=1955812 RepID=UPI0012294E51|nr:portal protein [Castellaniella sp.]TAN29582.1 MAG: phage head-tail adapter protein [Castellaniella sp.]